MEILSKAWRWKVGHADVQSDLGEIGYNRGCSILTYVPRILFAAYREFAILDQ